MPRARDASKAPFERILCGVDGSRSGHEAVRQAATLVAPGGRIELVAVAEEWGVGLNAAAVLSHTHARKALDEAAYEIRRCGADVVTRQLIGRAPWQIVLDESAKHDLVVVARHSRSRWGGIAIGRTTTNLVHRAHVPVLIAVPPPRWHPLPVAHPGCSRRPERAVRLAGRIARQKDAQVTLLRLDWSHRARNRELAAAAAELTALDVEPVEILVGGSPHRRI